MIKDDPCSRNGEHAYFSLAEDNAEQTTAWACARSPLGDARPFGELAGFEVDTTTQPTGDIQSGDRVAQRYSALY